MKNEAHATVTRGVDPGIRLGPSRSECLPEPDLVYEGPPPPTGWDEWNATLDALVQRVERYRKAAHETRRWANEELASLRARLKTGWRFAESFAARLHVDTGRPGRRPAARAKSALYKH